MRPVARAAPRSDMLPESERVVDLLKARVNYSEVWMSPIEINVLLRYVNGRNSYMEWGSGGGSTYNFPKFFETAISVEHDKAWCGTVQSRLKGDPNLQHVDYRCVPVERGYMGWGFPIMTEGNYTAFHNYVDVIDKLHIPKLDLVLVDGRARVDVATKVLSYISDSSVVVLHDASRIFETDEYRGVLGYYNMVDSVGGYKKQGLGILKRKREWKKLEGDHDAVRNILKSRWGLK